jgi:hypothetical protein
MIREYFKDASARIYYDQSLDTLFLEYTGRVKNEDHFILINSAVLTAFKSLDTRKFVADIRRMGVISLNSQEWVVKELLPGMVKHLRGKELFHAQLLDPVEIFSKVSASNIKRKAITIADKFDVYQYTDEAELKEHLLALDKVKTA